MGAGGAGRVPTEDEEDDDDEDEEVRRLLHKRLFLHLEGRQGKTAQMSQLQSNMAGERAQNKAEKRKLVRHPLPPASRASHPPHPSLFVQGDNRAWQPQSRRQLPPSRPVARSTHAPARAHVGIPLAGGGGRAGAQAAARRRAAARERERQHGHNAGPLLLAG